MTAFHEDQQAEVAAGLRQLAAQIDDGLVRMLEQTWQLLSVPRVPPVELRRYSWSFVFEEIPVEKPGPSV